MFAESEGQGKCQVYLLKPCLSSSKLRMEHSSKEASLIHSRQKSNTVIAPRSPIKALSKEPQGQATQPRPLLGSAADRICVWE